MYQTSPRRSRAQVISEILSEASEGANKTRLMYRCNLSFARSNCYLRQLLDAGVIERENPNPKGVTLYKTTDKGRKLLMVLRKANKLMAT
jgi:predicted transcriptional regulator